MERTIEIPTEDIAQFSTRFSLGRDRGMDSRQFLRIKVPAGELTSEHLRAIADLSDQYGRGYAEITDRQDIQLHWIQGKDGPEIFAKLDELGFTTDKCGQSYPGARYGDTRNVVVCPATGVNKHELIDVAPLAKKINDFFIGNLDYLDLPRKFKISITGCELGCTRPEMQDLGLFAVKRDGEVGFAAIVGGSLGPSQPGPRLGKPLGVFIRLDEVFDVAKAMVDVFKENGNRESKPKARFKWLVETWGLEKVRDEFEQKLGRKLERFEHGYPEVSGEEHTGIQEQKDGKKFICVPVVGGVLSSERLRGIADISDKFGEGKIRVTPYHNFILPHVQRDKLGAVLKRLGEIGLPVEGSPLRWTIVACASDFCGKSVEPHPKQVAKQIVEHLESRFGEKLNDLKLLVHLSGCMHDCGLHHIGHIGMLGVKAMGGDGVKQAYNLAVGGELGVKSSLSQPLERMLTPDQVIKMVENLVGGCLKEGFKDFGEFCRVHPLDAIKSIANEGVK
ncbi:MAG: nitrite/sulfite reductase [Candidatus Hadarchaeaceae archaeon]